MGARFGTEFFDLLRQVAEEKWAELNSDPETKQLISLEGMTLQDFEEEIRIEMIPS